MTGCEEDIKIRSAKESLERMSEKEKVEAEKATLTGAAKSLCVPFEQPALPEGAKCFACGKPAVNWTLFGRSY